MRRDDFTKKERPILFNGEMVRAILEDRKTMTRRVVKPAPQMVTDHKIEPWDGDPVALMRLLEASGRRCPFGAPGDRLWVRESGWERPYRTRAMMREGADTWKPFYYAADGEDGAQLREWGFKVRPSIHMPRWACRILLEITAVRVERLNDISEEDARAEGCRGGHGAVPGYGYNATAWEHFNSLWRSTYGADSWEANPWVWVVEFKRIEGAA